MRVGQADAHHGPEVEKQKDRLDELEKRVFDDPSPGLVRKFPAQKRDVSSVRLVIAPQLDVVWRLTRRDLEPSNVEMSFRCHDVYDQIVWIADDAVIFNDHITSVHEAYVSNGSNRLNEVMKVLTVVSVVLMLLTVLAGLYGMNVEMPNVPGGRDVQFWWLCAASAGVIVFMLAAFGRIRWS